MTLALIAAALLFVAIVYASVGHGGASGYLAVLALAGEPPDTIRPTALSLNVIVSTVALLRFAGRGHFRWRLFWPFAVTAVPCAFLAGWRWSLDEGAYRIAIAAVLLFAAWRLATASKTERDAHAPAPLAAALPIGAAIGLVSGLIGVGGGIFLSPILILCGWASAREAAAASAAFILVSSLAGIAGLVAQFGALNVRSPDIALFALAVLIGGVVGSTIGASRAPQTMLRRILAFVLLFAAIKLVLPR